VVASGSFFIDLAPFWRYNKSSGRAGKPFAEFLIYSNMPRSSLAADLIKNEQVNMGNMAKYI
jgi:hypothetical protein